MLRDESDRSQRNPYVPICVDDHPEDRTEDGWERSMPRAAIVGFCYSHLVVIAGSPLMGALVGAREPLWPGVLFFGVKGCRQHFTP